MNLLLALGFIRKYQARVRSQTLGGLRYHRVADYLGRPIPLAFYYRHEGGHPQPVEADVEEIFHYGSDYFLKARSPEGRRSLVYKWDRVSEPRVRHAGGPLSSLAELFQAAA